MAKNKNILEKIFLNPWYGGAVICAFIAMGSIFTVDSYVADKYNLNWLFVLIGVVFGVLAIFFMAKAFSTSTGEGG